MTQVSLLNSVYSQNSRGCSTKRGREMPQESWETSPLPTRKAGVLRKLSLRMVQQRASWQEPHYLVLRGISPGHEGPAESFAGFIQQEVQNQSLNPEGLSQLLPSGQHLLQPHSKNRPRQGFFTRQLGRWTLISPGPPPSSTHWLSRRLHTFIYLSPIFIFHISIFIFTLSISTPIANSG